MKGRAAVAAAAAGRDVAIPEQVLDWAPAEAIEIALEDGWTLHSAAPWCFESEVAARMELMAVVRRLVVAPDLVPDGRAIFMGADEAGFRLWMLTPPLRTIASRLLDALVERDVGAARAAIEDLGRASAALVRARGTAALPGGAAGVAVQDGRVVVLSLGDGGEAVDEHALALARRATATDPAGGACLEEARASCGARGATVNVVSSMGGRS